MRRSRRRAAAPLSVPVVPRLDRRRPDDLAPRVEDRPEHRLERPFGQPERRRRSPRSASRGGPSGRALDATSARYGLPGPPSPSIDRQTGPSASKWRRRAAGSSSRASRSRTVSRSRVSRADADGARGPAVAAEGGGPQASDRRVVVDARRAHQRRLPAVGRWLRPRRTTRARRGSSGWPAARRRRRTPRGPVDERVELAPEDVEPPGEGPGRSRPRGSSGAPRVRATTRSPKTRSASAQVASRASNGGRTASPVYSPGIAPGSPIAARSRRLDPPLAIEDAERDLDERPDPEREQHRAEPDRAAEQVAGDEDASARSSSAPAGWTSRSGGGARS